MPCAAIFDPRCELFAAPIYQKISPSRSALLARIRKNSVPRWDTITRSNENPASMKTPANTAARRELSKAMPLSYSRNDC